MFFLIDLRSLSLAPTMATIANILSNLVHQRCTDLTPSAKRSASISSMTALSITARSLNYLDRLAIILISFLVLQRWSMCSTMAIALRTSHGLSTGTPGCILFLYETSYLSMREIIISMVNTVTTLCISLLHAEQKLF